MQVINCHKQVMPRKKISKSVKNRSKFYSKSAQKIPFASAKTTHTPHKKSTLDAYFFLKTQLFISLFFIFFFWQDDTDRSHCVTFCHSHNAHPLRSASEGWNILHRHANRLTV